MHWNAFFVIFFFFYDHIALHKTREAKRSSSSRSHCRKYPDVRNFISCIVTSAIKLLTSPMKSIPRESGSIQPLYIHFTTVFSLTFFYANSPGALYRTGVIKTHATNILSAFPYYHLSLILSAPRNFSVRCLSRGISDAARCSVRHTSVTRLDI